MTKRIFTNQEIKQLQTNPNVERCTGKSITYQQAFKEQALRSYQEAYRTPQEIFVSAGFDLAVIGSKVPKQCLARWKRCGTEGRRGRKKGSGCSFPSLEAQVAYLRAENAFLKHLRAQRAEQYSSRKKNMNSSKNSQENIQ
jgi:hypothetical protein